MTDDAEDRVRWKEAESFADLCELTARFVEGRLEYQPLTGWFPLDDESDDIRTYLAAFNRAGLLTMDSQPGADGTAYDGRNYKQRSYLDAFAMEETARKIRDDLVETDLYVAVNGPRHDDGFGGLRMPVGLHAGEEGIWAGDAWWDYEQGRWPEAEPYEQDCGLGAVAELRRAWNVILIDLQWGRQEHLWDSLAAVIAPEVVGSYGSKPDHAST